MSRLRPGLRVTVVIALAALPPRRALADYGGLNCSLSLLKADSDFESRSTALNVSRTAPVNPGPRCPLEVPA